MIATNLNVEYKQMENSTKIECKTCGSIINKSGWLKHITTKKHLGGGNLVVLTSERNSKMRTLTNSLRTDRIKEIGIEKVREIERLKKKKQRAAIKAGLPQRIRNVHPAENKTDEIILELKEAEESVKKIDNKKERIKLVEVVNQARAQVATGEKTLPEAKKLVKATIQKIREDDNSVNNCEKLVDKLDNKNLKNLNSSQKVEKETLEGYIKNIGRIYKALSGEEWDCSDFTWLNATDVVIEHIENMKLENGTKRNYFNSIYSILRRIEGYSHLTTEYNKMKTFYGDMVDQARGQNKLTASEAKNILPWKTIVSYNDPTWTEEAKLLYKLYTAIPPRRLKDYGLMKYIKNKSVPTVRKLDKYYNYLVVNKNSNPIALVINNYKTKKRYGTYTVDLTLSDQKPHFRFSEIKKAIKSFAKETNIKSGELVFPNTKGKPYRRNFTTWLHFLFKALNKKISVNLLRHSFISNFLQKNPSVTDNTVKKMASVMGHNPNTFRSYRKLDAPIIESDSEYDSEED